MMSKNRDIKKAHWISSPVSSRLLTIEASCKYLSCSPDLLEDLIGAGDIPVIRLGSLPSKGKKDRRKRWIDINDIDKFIKSRKERFE